MAHSIARRVASGAALAASAASLIAAFATTAFALYLLRSAEDRRLEEAAVTFATELAHDGVDVDAIREVHRDESEEMEHTGMHFAVFDAEGRLLVGDARLGLPEAVGCVTQNANTLRVCRAQASNRLVAVVGASHTTLLPIFVAAAIFAALFAAVLAWFASDPISRRALAPLTRLRERIAALDVDAISHTDLGSEEQIVEVDALRSTLRQLIERVDRSLLQAHRFAANAAHELRTPLTSVCAELELLVEGTADENAREGGLRAQRRVADLTLLVERLLILSIPTRSSADAHELVSLRDLLEDTLAPLRPSERARVQLSEEDALVRGDAVLLGTMVANAIANALKFGDRVSTTLTVMEEVAVLQIDDDGPGIEPVERERVFEPFFRSTGALRLPGHGLGLALIRHVAQAHGGDALVQDKPDRGARLVIRLPTAREARARHDGC